MTETTFIPERPIAAVGEDGPETGTEAWPRPSDLPAAGESAAPTETSAAPIAAGDDLSLRWARTAERRRDKASRRLPVRRPGWRALVAGAVIVAMAALLVVAGLRIRHDDQLASARSSALAAATSDAKLIATYSYGTFGGYAKKIEAQSTAKFASTFAADSSTLGSVLTQYKAGSKGSVSGAGVGSVTTSKATVYVFLNETVNNVQSKASTERARMVVTLVRHNGHWLISNAIVE